ncbi:MAG: 6-hydroxymethyl-7,8-dihydropterin pyrophosphokinase [Thermoplasmata archaeon]|nr:MAG: 6-hydroxymethyl-7,8-dihydropterin pyrophosphokinase [Thermoplasmata archaeon]
MRYKEWEDMYKRIVEDLKIDVEADRKAASILQSLLEKKKSRFKPDILKNMIEDKDIIVFGAGPSLLGNINRNIDLISNSILISADGATTALIENDIQPDIIVSDLDGKISDQIDANKKGSIVIIHAHGNNIENLIHFIPRFQGVIFGTTQIDPSPYPLLYNYGGFTDGDRAVFLADHFKAKKIYLIGFDFNDEIGEYSFADRKDKKLKREKLRWCNYLINILNNPSIEFL